MRIFLKAAVLSPNPQRTLKKIGKYSIHQNKGLLFLIPEHLPVHYLRNNALPVGEDAHNSARDATREVEPL